MRIFFITIALLFSVNVKADEYHIFGIGVYDIKLDGSQKNQATDFRYERRFSNSLINIGPEQDNFFFLKPFLGFEYTSDQASYLLAGIYLEDNIGKLLSGNENKFIFTPSFGAGYYNNGSGKNLGNSLQFRTTLEIAYKLQDNRRLSLSVGHISNANLSDVNPGVEIISLSYHIPF